MTTDTTTTTKPDDEPDGEVVQRREFVRLTAAQRVILRDIEEENVIAVTLTVDVSGGGMLVKLPRGLKIKGQVVFELFLGAGDANKITGVARVVRSESHAHHWALTFEEFSKADRERLIRFIFDMQRKALALTRGDRI